MQKIHVPNGGAMIQFDNSRQLAMTSFASNSSSGSFRASEFAQAKPTGNLLDVLNSCF